MADWTEYAAAWGFFLLTHALPVRPPLRPWLVARLGARGFGLAYSALSLAALAWLIGAAGRAPHVPLWPQPAGAHWLALMLMLPAALLLALSLGRPNPFSFGGARNHLFDPRRPGMVRIARHPILLAVTIWAVGHLLVNGDLAHVLLFGGFAAFGVLGMRLIDRRRRREMGRADWQALRQRIKADKTAPTFRRADGLRLLAGAVGLVVVILLHRWFSGIDIWMRFMP